MLFEDDFFPIGGKESQRRSQSVERHSTEYLLPSFAREGATAFFVAWGEE
jgi:hypothetical protein